ncbi:MAG: DUF5977 domain-containing protein [Chitinophagaceae bacterium]|nr:DUF5977 domain-containing protein [Chitinophagaceae bacterium]
MYKNYLGTPQRILFLLLFLMSSTGSISQPAVTEVISDQDAYITGMSMSPQSYSFMKQGNHTMNLFNGQVLFQIPIYTYKDKDFNIPISLTYNSSGFMPNQREGIIGLGWSLNAGGGITRIVNGVPDDCTKALELRLSNGLLYGIRNNLEIKSVSKSSIFDLTVGTIPLDGAWNIGGCEAEPDLFNINVPGLSGRFYIENNGEIRTIGNKPFKVDLSGVGIQSHFGYGKRKVEDSEMILTTDDGFVYYFGGNISKLDVVFPMVGSDGEVSDPTINTWHLTKIIAPSGQTVEYKYKKYNSTITANHRPEDTHHFLLNANYLTFVYDEEFYIPQTSGKAEHYVMEQNTLVCSVTKTTYLEEILLPGKVSIKFSYGENERKFYKSVYDLVNDRFDQHNLRLNRIEVVDYSDHIRKDFEFTQTYWGGEEGRLFLTSFKAAGENPYTFTYYDTSFLPIPTIAGVDHWGYWNGRNIYSGSVIPQVTCYLNGETEIVGTQRDTDASKCKTAMLAKVVYPTQGYTLFDYEPHSYSQRLERRNDNNFLSKLYNESGYVGGARIKKVTDSDGKDNFNVREFKYTKDYPSSSNSSGILLQWPRYIFYFEHGVSILGIPKTKHLKIRSTSFNNTYLGTDYFIQYSEVTEITNGNGYTNYLYTDYVSNPDEDDYNTIKLHPFYFDETENIHLVNNYTGIYFNDKYFERGVVKRTRQYKFNGGTSYSLVKEIKTNSFTGKSDFPDLYLAAAHITGSVVQSYKKYYYPFLPKQAEETTYGTSGSPVVIINDYQYNSNGYLIKQTTTDSKGKIKKSLFSYPADYPAGTAFIDDMKSENILSPPIEKVAYIEEGGVPKILSGQVFKYNTGGRGELGEVLGLETGSTIPLGSFKFSNRSLGVLPPAGTSSGFSPDSKYQPQIKINNYDPSGNVLEQQKYNDVKQSFIWDYKSSYPVAQVVNAPVSDIAYTSFESDGTGNWSYTGEPEPDDTAPTGRKVFEIVNGDNDITKTGLSATTTYIVSYWKKSGTVSVNSTTPATGKTINGWTYYEHKVVNPSGGTITVSGTNGVIDELRLYPSGAQMTTYTYDPLIGMSSQCDINNRITYYEYDDAGKLLLVLDQDKNILKKYCYNYAGQVEDCEVHVRYYSQEKSGMATRNNCGTGMTGSQVTYTVWAGKYVSVISQADADNQAQADVDANKQAHANVNGTCTTIQLPVTLKNVGAEGNEHFYVDFIAQGGTAYTTHFNNVSLDPGETYSKDVNWGTYDITIESKTGYNMVFSLNGELKTGSIVTYTNVSITSAFTIYAAAYENTAQNVTYTRNNCPSGYNPTSVVYVVAAGVYTSLISQADANTQAIAQTASAGQAYANANGLCTPQGPSNTTIVYTNSLSKKVTLTLTNVSTSVVYTFSLNKNTTQGTAGSVPAGYYNVTMHTNGATDYYSIESYVQSIPDTDLVVNNIPLLMPTTTVIAY